MYGLGGMFDARQVNSGTPGMSIPGAAEKNQSALPPYVQSAINAAKVTGQDLGSVSYSGPQDFSSLQGIYDQTLGKADLGPSEDEIRRLYQGSVDAGMRLGSEQIRSGSGDRGAAPASGVEQQQARELGLRVQQPLTESLVQGAANRANAQRGGLSQLFGAASAPSSTSMGFRQPNVNNSGLQFGGSSLGKGTSSGGVNSNPWWSTSYGQMGSSQSDESNQWNAKQPGLGNAWDSAIADNYAKRG